jgi:hypothetical protein
MMSALPSDEAEEETLATKMLKRLPDEDVNEPEDLTDDVKRPTRDVGEYSTEDYMTIPTEAEPKTDMLPQDRPVTQNVDEAVNNKAQGVDVLKERVSGAGVGFGPEEDGWWGEAKEWYATPKVGAFLASMAAAGTDTVYGIGDIVGYLDEQDLKNRDYETAQISQLMDHDIVGNAAMWGGITGTIMDPVYWALPGMRRYGPAGRGIATPFQEIAKAKFKGVIKNEAPAIAYWAAIGGVAGLLQHSGREDGRWWNAIQGAGLSLGVFGMLGAAKGLARVGVKIKDYIAETGGEMLGIGKTRSAMRSVQAASELKIKYGDAAEGLDQDGLMNIISRHYADNPNDMTPFTDPVKLQAAVDNLRVMLKSQTWPTTLSPAHRQQAIEDLGLRPFQAAKRFKDDQHLFAAHLLHGQFGANLKSDAVNLMNSIQPGKSMPPEQQMFKFLRSYVGFMNATRHITGAAPDRQLSVATKWLDRIEQVFTRPRPVNPATGKAAARSPQDEQLLREAYSAVVGGEGKLMDIAELVYVADSLPNTMNMLNRWHQRGKTEAEFRQVMLSNMLWNPNSWGANFVGNATFNALNLAETGVAAITSKLVTGGRNTLAWTFRNPSLKMKDKDKVFLSEFGAEIVGSAPGMIKGTMKFAKVMLGVEKGGSTIASKFFGEIRDIEKGKLLKAATFPLRILLATDEGFKELRRHQGALRMAVRNRKMGEAGGVMEEYRSIMQGDVIGGKYQLMKDKLEMMAEDVTFTKALRKGSPSQAVQSWANQHLSVKMLAPFIQSPVNITTSATKRIPLLGNKKVFKSLMKGEPQYRKWFEEEITKEGSKMRAQIMQTSKAVLSTMIGGTMAYWAAEGKLTGMGPTDPIRAKMYRDAGYPPNSFTLDKYEYGLDKNMSFSFNRLEPVGWTMAVGAAMGDIARYTTADEYTEFTSSFLTALEGLVLDKTYLANISQIFATIEKRDVTALGAQIGSALTPFSGLLGAARRIDDPIKRSTQANTAWSDNADIKSVNRLFTRYMTRIARFSENYVPDVNMFGEVLKQGGGVIADDDILVDEQNKRITYRGEKNYMERLFNSFYPVEAINDPYKELVAALGVTEKHPSKDIEGVQLTDWQYARLKMKAGKIFKERVQIVLDSQASVDDLIKTGFYRDTTTDSDSFYGDILGLVTESNKEEKDQYPRRGTKGVVWMDFDGHLTPVKADAPILDLPKESIRKILEHEYERSVGVARGELLTEGGGELLDVTIEILQQEAEEEATTLVRDRPSSYNYYPPRTTTPQPVGRQAAGS